MGNDYQQMGSVALQREVQAGIAQSCLVAGKTL